MEKSTPNSNDKGLKIYLKFFPIINSFTGLGLKNTEDLAINSDFNYCTLIALQNGSEDWR